MLLKGSVLVALVMATAVATGCGSSIQTTVINPSPRPMTPRDPASVEIFSSGPPTRAHVDVAYLEAEQDTTLSVDGTPQFVIKLRASAAAHGCDGIVIGGTTNHAVGRDGSTRGLTATCIVYTDAGEDMAKK